MAKCDEGNMYPMICEPRFDKIDAKQEEILTVLKGRNGDPGVLDDVRNLKKWHKATLGFVIFIGSAFTLQVIRDVWTWARTIF